jgi:hypothetical protein
MTRWLRHREVAREAQSVVVNDLIHSALRRVRLGILVNQMEEEAGRASPEAYARVSAPWSDEVETIASRAPRFVDL